MLIFAHRGASGEHPENTLQAFEEAIRAGSDYIELDVQLSRDEVPVVIHDESVNRTTDGTGYVDELPLSRLKELECEAGETIPTLEEALTFIDGRVPINVELRHRGLAPVVSNLIDKSVRTGNWSPDQFIVSSFLHGELARVGSLFPELRLGLLLYGSPLDLPSTLEALPGRLYSVHLSKRFPEPEIIETARQRELAVFAYVVNEPEDLRRMANLGMDGIFTDYPERVRREISRKR